MENISKKINKLYQKLYFLDEHPFYKDLNDVENIDKNFINYKKIKIKEKVKFNFKKEIPKSIKFTEKKLSKFNYQLLEKLNIEMSKSDNINNIINLVDQLYFMEIPTNVKNLDFIIKKYKNSDRINIAILGAGPIGLFLACYLFKYYNFSYGLNNQPKVNIIVFDNRITRKGFKKPYTRSRPFAFGSSFFSFLIPNIYSWDKSQEYLLIQIYILEYILFCLAYQNFKIPFVFEEYDWNSYTEFFKKSRIDVVFDCTGGRLNPPIFKNINTEWMDIFKINEKYPKLLVNEKTNLVTLDISKDNLIKNYYYGSIIVFNKDEFPIDKIDINISNINDLKLFLKLKNNFYDYQALIKISTYLEDDLERNFFYNTIKTFNKNTIFKVDIFHTNMKHALIVSNTLNINNHKFLYIAAGDTIFHGHFVTGSGLNRTITFAVKCANFLTSLFLE
tara:strand:+ start:109 stop:1446 length:1338 start_codon:yes stop_codon:yes gene_type:complete